MKRIAKQKAGLELVRGQCDRNSGIHSSLLSVCALTDRSALDDLNRTRVNEANREDRPLMPARIEQEMLRAVARAAARSGSLALHACVRDRVRAHFEKRCADVLSELPAELEVDVVTAWLAETDSQHVAEPHQAVAAVRPDCVVSLERSVETSRSYRRKLDVYLAAADRKVIELRRRFSRTTPQRMWT